MKRRIVKYLIVIFVCIACEKEGNNDVVVTPVNQDGLKNNPSFVSVKLYKAELLGEALEKQNLIQEEQWGYNEQGLKIFFQLTDSVGEIITRQEWRYSKGNSVFFSVYAKGRYGFFSTDEYYYNEYGDIIKFKTYDKDGSFIGEGEHSYTYDEKGNKTSEILRNSAGEVFQNNTYEYAYEGDTAYVLSKYHINLTSGAKFLDDKYRYVFDCNGNILRKENVDERVYQPADTKIYEYDSHDRLIFESHINIYEEVYHYESDFNIEGNLIFYSVQYEYLGYRNEYEYDESNNVILSENYNIGGTQNPQNKSLISKTEYKYKEIDNKENWTLSEMYYTTGTDVEYSIAEREIEY